MAIHTGMHKAITPNIGLDRVDIGPIQPQVPTLPVPSQRRLDTVKASEDRNDILRELRGEEAKGAGTGEGAKGSSARGRSSDTPLERIDGEAFRSNRLGEVQPPSPFDVSGVQLPDAWLAASLAAVAAASPQHLQNRVSKNGDGSFNVRLGNRAERVEPEFPAEVARA